MRSLSLLIYYRKAIISFKGEFFPVSGFWGYFVIFRTGLFFLELREWENERY